MVIPLLANQDLTPMRPAAEQKGYLPTSIDCDEM